MAGKKHGPIATRYLLERDGKIHAEAIAYLDMLEIMGAQLKAQVDDAATYLKAAAEDLMAESPTDAARYREKAKALLEDVAEVIAEEAPDNKESQ